MISLPINFSKSVSKKIETVLTSKIELILFCSWSKLGSNSYPGVHCHTRKKLLALVILAEHEAARVKKFRSMILALVGAHLVYFALNLSKPSTTSSSRQILFSC
jgi:hypothetical protein